MITVSFFVLVTAWQCEMMFDDWFSNTNAISCGRCFACCTLHLSIKRWMIVGGGRGRFTFRILWNRIYCVSEKFIAYIFVKLNWVKCRECWHISHWNDLCTNSYDTIHSLQWYNSNRLWCMIYTYNLLSTLSMFIQRLISNQIFTYTRKELIRNVAKLPRNPSNRSSESEKDMNETRRIISINIWNTRSWNLFCPFLEINLHTLSRIL